MAGVAFNFGPHSDPVFNAVLSSAVAFKVSELKSPVDDRAFSFVKGLVLVSLLQSCLCGPLWCEVAGF